MRLITLLTFVLAASACAASPPPPRPQPEPSQTGEPVLLITEPELLLELEKRGYAFGDYLLGESVAQNREAYAHPLYESMVEVLAEDLDALEEADPKSGVGMRYNHRLFNARWLRSKKMGFALVAVVNRVDRHPFHPERCGEIRLVYRLSYTTQVEEMEIRSRLPMTVNVVSWGPPSEGGCQEAAKDWLVPQGESPADVAALSAPDVLRSRLKSVEVNLQSVRWPSTMRPDMAGHAEYLLRVFHPNAKGNRLRPARLENTPDVAKLKRSKSLRKELLTWLSQPENLRAIEEGTAVLPDDFLARSATSVAPRGMTRYANRPFNAVLDTDDFADLDLSSYAQIGSPVALLRRLDGMSCMGCHQARSVAGFHLLGEDPPERKVDALAFAASPHLLDDRVRRDRYMRALVAGEKPDEQRPHAERTPHLSSGFGEHCGLGDPGLAAWTCAPGLTCVPSEDGEIGWCLAEEGRVVGEPCETGRYKARKDRHKDRIRDLEEVACAGHGVCEVNEVGFPEGMCAVDCSDVETDDRVVCGGIPLLTEFNRCVASKTPFDQCIQDNARPAGLRACNPEKPCRDDYICARVSGSDGACMPPYFLFQLRVDGHPL